MRRHELLAKFNSSKDDPKDLKLREMRLARIKDLKRDLVDAQRQSDNERVKNLKEEIKAHEDRL